MTAATAPCATRPRLDSDQVERFRDLGYLVVTEPVFGDAKFKSLQAYFDELLLSYPGARPESLDVPHFIHNRLHEWLLDDAILDLVEPLLGPDIALFSSHFICKPGGDGKRVPWHEDSAYWGNMLTPMEVVTVWLALDRSDAGNGCMHIIPKSHRLGKAGYSDYADVDDPANNVFGREILKDQLNAKNAVDLVLDPNQASLHDGKLMHGSNKNSSDRRRCGYTMRYISTRSLMHPSRLPHHRLYLARGKDHAGNHYADPSRTYPEPHRGAQRALKRSAKGTEPTLQQPGRPASSRGTAADRAMATSLPPSRVPELISLAA